MPHNVLVTGASGHLGGSFLATWAADSNNIITTGYDTLYALVRCDLTPDGIRKLVPENGKRGFCLASSGSVRWDDIYAAAGRALVKRGVIIDATVRRADDEKVKAMARGSNVGSESVVFKIGGQ
ncbi:uncharacterized protein IWZ02DRAFT_489436 [Phyllosticta citriasiana]|uniref:uncharacterized protein n=1 Tax=Phyllosticta citriasiana TaxID=595635 RepID=UPI0030FD7638